MSLLMCCLFVLVMDCFPLPVEGTETRVVADDEEVQAYMVNMSESLEQVGCCRGKYSIFYQRVGISLNMHQ